MGRSAGTGSPIAFRCLEERNSKAWHPFEYTFRLTGRTRPYRSPRGSVTGQRSVHTSYEYECDCGYIGWSNHVDLARMAGDDEALIRRGFSPTRGERK